MSHAGIYLLARGVPGLVTFATIPLFTRLLDRADYGRYALVLASMHLINALVFQWLKLSLTRYLPAHSADPARLKSTLFTTGLVMIGIIGLIGAAVCPFVGWHWAGVIACTWVLLGGQWTYELCSEYSRAAIRPWDYMVMQLGRAILSIAVSVLLIWLGSKWLGAVIGLTVATTAAVVYACVRDWRDVRIRIDRELLKRLATYGVPVSMTVALTIVIFSCDRFLIAWRLGEDAAGLYSVASDFTSQTLTLLMMVISMASFPLAVRAWEHEGQAAAAEHMKTNAALLLAVGLPCVVGLTILAEGITGTLFGKRFHDAGTLMPLFAVAAFIAGLKAFHFDAAFQFAHRTIYQVWIVLAAAVLNVVANLFVIPRWGIEGAAVTSGVTYLLTMVLTIVFGRRQFKMPFPWTAFGQVLVACAAMSVVLMPFRAHQTLPAVTLQIAAGAATYAAVLIGSNFMNLRTVFAARLRRNTAAPLATVPDAGVNL